MVVTVAAVLCDKTQALLPVARRSQSPLDFVCDPRGPVKTRRLCRGDPIKHVEAKERGNAYEPAASYE